MGLMDLFKAKENANLKAEISELKKLLTPEQLEILNLNDQINQLNTTKEDLESNIKELKEQLLVLQEKISIKNQELINLDDEVLLQEFGLYNPLYSFASSDLYKEKLAQLRDKQKNMIKEKTAVNYRTDWTVNGSKAEGTKMTNNNIKQILRTFNIECENAIDRVKFNNIESMEKRIMKSFDDLNKMNKSSQVSLNHSYLDLKLEELHLSHEYQLKKQEEKEEQKRRREELREEAKLQKELEEARKHVYKDQKHFEQALQKLNQQLDNENLDAEQKQLLLQKHTEIEGQLTQLNEQLNDIDYRQSNQRAGYVYIISNIGAFGENIYKIGMTRRLDPQDRVDELGDASVPFNFDVHAMIFTEDAPTLENALHKAFENKKVNMINQHREFFNVTLEKIEQVVKENFDKTVDFISTPPAEQYRESLRMKTNS